MVRIVMARPKKAEIGAIPTKQKILDEAMKLFSKYSYDAVSIRNITKSLGLNEASLYNHYKSKEELLNAIFDKMNNDLIQPGFTVPPSEYFINMENFILSDFLIEGAKTFFNRANEKTHYTWRILVSHQFRFETARDSVRTFLLDSPSSFFSNLLSSLKDAGKIRPNIDCETTGRMLAAIFFDYSFRENLNIKWDEETSDFGKLCEEIKVFSEYISV